MHPRPLCRGRGRHLLLRALRPRVKGPTKHRRPSLTDGLPMSRLARSPGPSPFWQGQDRRYASFRSQALTRPSLRPSTSSSSRRATGTLPGRGPKIGRQRMSSAQGSPRAPACPNGRRPRSTSRSPLRPHRQTRGRYLPNRRLRVAARQSSRSGLEQAGRGTQLGTAAAAKWPEVTERRDRPATPTTPAGRGGIRNARSVAFGHLVHVILGQFCAVRNSCCAALLRGMDTIHPQGLAGRVDP